MNTALLHKEKRTESHRFGDWFCLERKIKKKHICEDLYKSIN